MIRLPPEAVAWIKQVLLYEGGAGLAENLNHGPLSAEIYLSVAQFKKLLGALKHLPFVRQHPLGRPRAYSSLRKVAVSNLFFKYVFEDDQFSIPNAEALLDFAAATKNGNSAEATCEAGKQQTAGPPAHHRSPATRALPLVRPVELPSGPPQPFSSGIEMKENPYSRAGQKRQCPGLNSIPSFPPSSWTDGSSRAVYVKGEDALPEEVPHNDQERRILGALQTMGFGDPREILSSVRKIVASKHLRPVTASHPQSAFPAWKPNSTPLIYVSTDEVMLDIISMREEADEAKKMDEARRQSERSRKEEAKKRRKLLEEQFQIQLEQGTIQSWRADPEMFKSSWILTDEVACRVLEQATVDNQVAKKKLIELLKLEKLSFKWFRNLPQAYFTDFVVTRINQCADSSSSDATDRQTEECLADLIGLLQHAMYNLNEQNKNGVPLAFLQAHDSWSVRNLAVYDGNGPGKADDGDSVVLVVDVPAVTTASPSKVSSADTLPLTASPSKAMTVTQFPTFMNGRKPPEIIEIL